MKSCAPVATIVIIIVLILFLYALGVAFNLFGATLPVDPATVSAPLY